VENASHGFHPSFCAKARHGVLKSNQPQIDDKPLVVMAFLAVKQKPVNAGDVDAGKGNFTPGAGQHPHHEPAGEKIGQKSLNQRDGEHGLKLLIRIFHMGEFIRRDARQYRGDYRQNNDQGVDEVFNDLFGRHRFSVMKA